MKFSFIITVSPELARSAEQNAEILKAKLALGAQRVDYYRDQIVQQSGRAPRVPKGRRILLMPRPFAFYVNPLRVLRTLVEVATLSPRAKRENSRARRAYIETRERSRRRRRRRFEHEKRISSSAKR